MKPKAPTLNFLLVLLMALITLGFTACSNDDDDLNTVIYQGYIKDIQPEADLFSIRITKVPSDPRFDMPGNDALIGINLNDFSCIDLNVEQKLSFRIVSAQVCPVPTYGPSRDYISFHCKIIITKLH